MISVSAFAAFGSVALAKSNHMNQNDQGNNNQNMMQQMQEEQQERMNEIKTQFPEHRFTSMYGDSNFAYFLSVKSGNSTSAFALRIADEGVPSIYTILANVTKDGQNLTADWVTGILRVRGLVEYNDTNGDKVFTTGNDTRIQFVDFAKLDWSLSTSKLNVSGTTGWNITFSASDKGATYVITTQVFNTGATLPDGTPIAPNEAKIDFIFLNFPWQSNSSRLALLTFFGGQQASAQVTRTDNQTEAVVNKNSFAYFTWASTAMVNNTSVAVVSQSTKEANGHVVELNYPQGTNITHDPVVGVGSGSIQSIPSYQVPSSSSNAISSALPGANWLVATALVVAGAAVLALAARKRMVEPKLQF